MVNIVQEYYSEYYVKIVNSLKACEYVDCIALGGSRSTGINDKHSDYDIYVYVTKELSHDTRMKAVAPFCLTYEICNHYWESEDNCIMKDGIEIDIIYRFADMFDKMLSEIVLNGHAMNGYTTSFWHNIKMSKVIFDKSGKFSEIQKKFTVEYPPKLRANIIEKNRNLLSGKLPSYDMQIKKSEQRQDFVSVQHRITAFLESYFDIIFAINKQTHPGEKRILSLCKKNCKLLPKDFEKNVMLLITSVGSGKSFEYAEQIVAELDTLIVENI